MDLQNCISSIIYLLFPFAVYLIHLIYIKNMDLEEKNIYLELSIFTSLYLILRTGLKTDNTTTMALFHMTIFNIPLLIAYMKKKYRAALVISLIMVIYFHINLNIGVTLLITEYTAYFITYVFLIRKRPNPKMIINNFVVIKTFILTVKVFVIYNPTGDFLYNIMIVTLSMILFTIAAYIIIYLLNMSEDIVSLNNTVSELEKEKHLRYSLSKLTHEIKNPIAVCKGYLDMIDYNDETNTRKYIQIMKGEIERSIGIMDEFLDYSKVKISKEEVDLYMLIEEVWDSVEALYKKNNVNGKLYIPEDELYIQLDYNRMKQVFVNIFKNSIEAKGEKKRMTIELKTEVKSDFIEIRIKDSGKGMCEEDLKNIGEMFYTTKNKGTGLGVALTKEIIELHGGNINYESILGKGTTVSILLPLT